MPPNCLPGGGPIRVECQVITAVARAVAAFMPRQHRAESAHGAWRRSHGPRELRSLAIFVSGVSEGSSELALTVDGHRSERSEREAQSVGEACGLRCGAVPGVLANEVSQGSEDERSESFGGLEGRTVCGATEGKATMPSGERCEADRREASMRTGNVVTREQSDP